MNWRELYGGVRDTFLLVLLLPLFLFVAIPPSVEGLSTEDPMRWFVAYWWIQEQWRIVNAD